MSTNYYHPNTLEHIRNPLPAVADWANATTLPVPEYDRRRTSAGLWRADGWPPLYQGQTWPS